MADNISNFIKIDANQVTGNIATMSFDIDVTGEAVGTNKEGKPYFTLTLNTGHTRWYANLGKYPGQDDDSLYAVIPNDYLNNPERRQ